MSYRARLRRLERLRPSGATSGGRLTFVFLNVPDVGTVASIGGELFPVDDPDALMAAHPRDSFSVVSGIVPWIVCGQDRPGELPRWDGEPGGRK